MKSVIAGRLAGQPHAPRPDHLLGPHLSQDVAEQALGRPHAARAEALAQLGHDVGCARGERARVWRAEPLAQGPRG